MYDKKVTLKPGQAHCDRCAGYTVFASHTLNGRIVPVQPDAGRCYRCNGSGVDPYIIEPIQPMQNPYDTWYTQFE